MLRGVELPFLPCHTNRESGGTHARGLYIGTQAPCDTWFMVPALNFVYMISCTFPANETTKA